MKQPGGGDRPASSTGEWRLADHHPTLRRMEFSMTVAACARLTPPALSTDRLLDTPLPQLLDEFGVDVSVVPADPGFTGGTYVRDDGSVLFVRPAGRPDAEWEMMARSMLGAVLRVPVPDLPEPYQLTVLADR